MDLPRATVTANDAVYDYKNDMFLLRAIFTLKKTGASRSKHCHAFHFFRLVSEKCESHIILPFLSLICLMFSIRSSQHLHQSTPKPSEHPPHHASTTCAPPPWRTHHSNHADLTPCESQHLQLDKVPQNYGSSSPVCLSRRASQKLTRKLTFK